MDSLRERTGSDLDVIMVGPWKLGTWKTAAGATFIRQIITVSTDAFEASTPAPPLPRRKTRQARHFRLQSPRNTVNTDVVGVCAVRVNSTLLPFTKAAIPQASQKPSLPQNKPVLTMTLQREAPDKALNP